MRCEISRLKINRGEVEEARSKLEWKLGINAAATGAS